MRPAKRTFQVLFISLLTLICAEIGARIYVDLILKRSPAFRLDPVVGWKPIRSTNLAQDADLKGGQKLLVIGDSFVFGEGVDLEDRFDRQMKNKGFRHDIISVGVSGYATDQELLASEAQIAHLREGDTAILVTFGDDFRGLLSDFFAGRHKPRYRKDGESWILSPPSIGFMAIAMDKFYVVRIFGNKFFPRRAASGPFDPQGLVEAESIYEHLLTEYLLPAFQRGVKIVVVFHGHKIVDEDFGQGMGSHMEEKLRRICQKHSFEYISADPELDHGQYRQVGNIHWNALGHQKFGELLMRTCDNSNNQLHLLSVH
jgi:hypothetical protein